MSVETIVGAEKSQLSEREQAERVLTEARREIDDIDEQRVQLLARRLQLAFAVREAKLMLGQPIYNGQREREVQDRYVQMATGLGVYGDVARQEIVATILACRSAQISVPVGGPE